MIAVAGPNKTHWCRAHVFGASLDYGPVGMLLTGWALSRTDGWRSVRRRLMIAASIAFLLMIGFTAALPRDSHFGPGVYTGLIGRLLLLSYLGWITAVSLAVLRLERGADAPSSTSPNQAQSQSHG